MTPAQYETLQGHARKYFQGLDLLTIKIEMSQGALLITNHKLEKGDGFNLGLELIPADLLGAKHNTCAMAGDCKLVCVFLTGKTQVMRSVSMLLSDTLKKRIRRYFLWKNDRRFFLELLKLEILRGKLVADAIGARFAVRLNVVSDLSWHRFTDSMPDIQFYDYTKIWSRKSTANYYLTYSASERVTDAQIISKLADGGNVAIVFPSKVFPSTWRAFPVIDGDASDERIADVRGAVVALALKTSQGGKDITNKLVRA